MANDHEHGWAMNLRFRVTYGYSEGCCFVWRRIRSEVFAVMAKTSFKQFAAFLLLQTIHAFGRVDWIVGLRYQLMILSLDAN